MTPERVGASFTLLTALYFPSGIRGQLHANKGAQERGEGLSELCLICKGREVEGW